MSVKIRLSRHGSKKKPFYRIVAADSRSPRDGRYLELLGTYDPAPSPPRVTVKQGLLEKWLARGAKPSDTVSTVLKRAGFPVRPGAAASEAAPTMAPGAPAAAEATDA